MQGLRRVLLVMMAGLAVVLAFELAAGTRQHAEAAPNTIRVTAATLGNGCSPTSPGISLLTLPNDGSVTVYLCVIVTDSATGLGVPDQVVGLIIISEPPVVTAASNTSTLPPPQYVTDSRGVVAVRYAGAGPIGSSSFVATISTPNSAQAGLLINLVSPDLFHDTGIPATPPTLTPTPPTPPATTTPPPPITPTPPTPPPSTPTPPTITPGPGTPTPAAPPPAPSPTPVATSTATGTPAAPPPPPSFTGGRVASAGISIVSFTGTIAELNAAGLAANAVTISATVNGRLRTYVVGAPDFVNAEFAAAFPNGLKDVPVILRTQARQSIQDRAALQTSSQTSSMSDQTRGSRRQPARSGTW